ncbi:DUF6325 family protein [Microbacterium sp. GXF0217]
MADFRFGPVELYLVGFEGERPDPATLGALTDLLASGLVRLLDFVLVAKSEDGEIEVIEVDAEADALGLGGVEIHASGIAGGEDIDELAEQIPPGGSAALVVLELSYARALAEQFNASGGVLLRSERVPAPIVNAMVDVLENEGE